jgi:hypothetical protein
MLTISEVAKFRKVLASDIFVHTTNPNNGLDEVCSLYLP